MTTTLNLSEGDRIHFPATLNSKAFYGTVISVEPWMLTAGPRAGEQARQGRGKNGPLLYTVHLAGVETYGETTGRGPSATSNRDILDGDTVRNMAVTAEHEWEVVG